MPRPVALIVKRALMTAVMSALGTVCLPSMVGHWAGSPVPIGGVNDPCPPTSPQPGVSTACSPRPSV
eukprot:11093469-Karenia_brevis.AAC.1